MIYGFIDECCLDNCFFVYLFFYIQYNHILIIKVTNKCEKQLKYLFNFYMKIKNIISITLPEILQFPANWLAHNQAVNAVGTK